MENFKPGDRVDVDGRIGTVIRERMFGVGLSESTSAVHDTEIDFGDGQTLWVPIKRVRLVDEAEGVRDGQS